MFLDKMMQVRIILSTFAHEMGGVGSEDNSQLSI